MSRCYCDNNLYYIYITQIMKTEHEKLKEITDVIGYKIIWFRQEWYLIVRDWPDEWERLINANVREIIFTQEFMDKLLDYNTKRLWLENSSKLAEAINYNLNDPVTYLYNTLELWNK